MNEFFAWFTEHDNSKILALLIFFFTFCGILLYVYTGKRRKARLESYKYIPLNDEDGGPDRDRKVNEDGRRQDH